MTARADHEAWKTAYRELLSARTALAHEVNVNAFVLLPGFVIDGTLSGRTRRIVGLLLLALEPLLSGFVAS